jgi:GT2 family glycosyltransferase
MTATDRGAGAAAEAAAERPAATVIVLAFNAGAFIRRSLESLRRQTFGEPFEVVVVWSGDARTPAIVRREFPEILLVGRQQRVPTGAARNLGIARASGEVIAFLAADCEAAPDWLERRVAAHREGHDLVGGAVVWREPANAFARASHLLEYNACPPGRPREVVPDPVYNLSFRRSVFERFGRYHETLPCGEDTALIWSLVASGQHFLFDPSIRIVHPGATSLSEFWRHQTWHGLWMGRLSRRQQVPGLGGSGVRHLVWLVALYPVSRLVRMWRRLLGWQRDWAAQAALLTPLLLLGLVVATLGLVKGLLQPAEEESPAGPDRVLTPAAGPGGGA